MCIYYNSIWVESQTNCSIGRPPDPTRTTQWFCFSMTHIAGRDDRDLQLLSWRFDPRYDVQQSQYDGSLHKRGYKYYYLLYKIKIVDLPVTVHVRKFCSSMSWCILQYTTYHNYISKCSIMNRFNYVFPPVVVVLSIIQSPILIFWL